MRRWLIDLLVAPETGKRLVVGPGSRWDGEDLCAGELTDGTSSFPVRNGIARFVGEAADAATSATFSFKWSRQDSYESEAFRSWYTGWLLDKYGFRDLEDAGRHLAGDPLVLEVGCGSGLSSVLSRSGLAAGGRWVGLDLTDAVDVARSRLGDHPRAGFVQADLLHPPFAAGTFDVIFSEGVLHHTPSTRDALAAVARLLRPGGVIHFYVYAQKAPVREWADDYIRSIVSRLPAEEAWRQMRPLTALAKALSELGATVDVPEDVPLLGIKAGRHDVQRLIYWHFAKLYWNPAMGFEGSNHVNFDWYHPPYANRQTLDAVRAWCVELGLRIEREHVQESGYTIRAVKV